MFRVLNWIWCKRPRKQKSVHQAPVVQKVDSAIHRINQYPADKRVRNNCVICWIVIYPSDSAIHLLNNRGQFFTQKEMTMLFVMRCSMKQQTFLLCTTLIRASLEEQKGSNSVKMLRQILLPPVGRGQFTFHF